MIITFYYLSSDVIALANYKKYVFPQHYFIFSFGDVFHVPLTGQQKKQFNVRHARFEFMRAQHNGGSPQTLTAE